MAKAVLSKLLRLRIRPDVTAENMSREDILSPVQMLTTSKEIDEQLKLARKVVDFVDISNRKNCVTLMWCSGTALESSSAQGRLLAGRLRKDLSRIVYLKHKKDKILAQHFVCSVW